MVFQNNVLSGAAGSGTTVHTIDQSIRFNDDDSAYMSRTFSASNRKTLTFSCWVKRGNQGTNQNIFGPQTSNSGSGTYGVIRLNPQNELDIFDYTNGTTNWRLQSTQLLRDSSAWYHFVFSMDTSNSISSERLRMYINGQRVTDFDVETQPSLNYEGQWNNNLSHEIGAIQRGSTNQYFDGYLAEIVFIDGQALSCDSFGEFNSSGIWVPKDISGLTFGTNGCHIDGRDASDLGDDESGNGNDFTTSGLAAHDQVSDTPTNNFATINPLDWSIRNAANSVPLSEGNLKFTGSDSTGVYGTYYTTIQVPSTGSWYFELVPTAIGSAEKQSQYIYVGSVGFLANGNTNAGAYGSAWSAGDIIGVAVNSTGVWFSINGTYQNSGNPATGSNPAGTTSLPGAILIGDGSATTNSSSTGVLNFGQDGTFAGNKTAQGNKDSSGIGNFYYSPPSGFKALCTKNLGS